MALPKPQKATRPWGLITSFFDKDRISSAGCKLSSILLQPDVLNAPLTTQHAHVPVKLNSNQARCMCAAHGVAQPVCRSYGSTGLDPPSAPQKQVETRKPNPPLSRTKSPKSKRRKQPPAVGLRRGDIPWGSRQPWTIDYQTSLANLHLAEISHILDTSEVL